MDLRVDEMHAPLEAIVEFPLATPTSKHLGLDDQLASPCARSLVDQKYCARNDGPKFFATSKASSGVFAAMLLGVAIPY